MNLTARRAGASLILVLILFLSTLPDWSLAGSPSPPKPHRVLWIGNSFTQYNGGIPAMVQALVNARDGDAGSNFKTGMRAVGGAHLSDHAASAALPLDQGWDLVVVQGYSDGPINPAKSANFERSLHSLNARIGAAGARTALFMTWAYKDRPSMTEALANAYGKAAEAIGAFAVPVGLAFAAASQEHSAPPLYIVNDNKHPSLAGSYLAACTFYAAFWGRSPEGGYVPLGVSESQAQLLQRTAWTTVQRYFGWPSDGLYAGISGKSASLPKNQ